MSACQVSTLLKVTSLRLVTIVVLMLLTGCTTLTEPDCAIGDIKSNAAPVIGASYTGAHISAVLGKTDAEQERCMKILQGAMELRKAGML